MHFVQVAVVVKVQVVAVRVAQTIFCRYHYSVHTVRFVQVAVVVKVDAVVVRVVVMVKVQTM